MSYSHLLPELTANLALAALAVFVLLFLICKTYLSIAQAYTVASVKTIITFWYFAFYFDGQWTFFDDWSYLNVGHQALGYGYGPFGSLVHVGFWHALQSATGSIDTFYYWWNALAESVFGYHYWAPVFLNVILTAVTGLVVYLIAVRIDYSRRQARAVAIFVMLQWEFVAWTSFTNLKDAFVALLTASSLLGVVATYHALAEDCKRRMLRVTGWMALTLLSLAVVFFMRFYVPAIFGAALILWLAASLGGRGVAIGVAVAAGIAIFFKVLFLSNRMFIDLGGALYGAVHFLFTPLPWRLEPSYSFLLVPSILNWMWLPFVIYGAGTLWIRSKLARILVIYSIIIWGFYSVVPLLQGPRHRVQILPLLTVFCYEGIVQLLLRRRPSEFQDSDARFGLQPRIGGATVRDWRRSRR